MKLLIDNIDSVTGWSGSGGASVHALNEIDDYIAGDNQASVMFRFNGSGGYIEKSIAADVRDYTEIVFWVFSIMKNKNNYRYASDFQYKIDFGGSKEYYLYTHETFQCVKINVADIESISRVRITALHSDTDYLVLSYCVASMPELPLDIYDGIKEKLEKHISENINAKEIGTMSAAAEDEYIEFTSAAPFIDRYTAIRISDGTHSEIHCITKIVDGKVYFNQLYDGRKIKYNYTDAIVYLYYPVLYGTLQKEIAVPSIAIWGFESDKELHATDLDVNIEQVEVNGPFYERKVGHYLKWLILIDCIAKEEWECLDELARAARKVLSQRTIWVGGRKVNLEWEGSPVEQYPTEAHDLVPKIQYPASVSMLENIYELKAVPVTKTINLDVIIAEQGEIQ